MVEKGGGEVFILRLSKRKETIETCNISKDKNDLYQPLIINKNLS